MKNLIEQKNILLREASESLREVYRMSKVNLTSCRADGGECTSNLTFR